LDDDTVVVVVVVSMVGIRCGTPVETRPQTNQGSTSGRTTYASEIQGWGWQQIGRKTTQESGPWKVFIIVCNFFFVS